MPKPQSPLGEVFDASHQEALAEAIATTWHDIEAMFLDADGKCDHCGADEGTHSEQCPIFPAFDGLRRTFEMVRTSEGMEWPWQTPPHHPVSKAPKRDTTGRRQLTLKPGR